jgi:quinol monooxygenase YgiN
VLFGGDGDRNGERPTMKKNSYAPADLNEGFVVAVTIEAGEGEADAVAALIAGLVAPTLAEPGVKLFIPYRSPTNPHLFFIFELYVNEDGWRAHQETAHFKAAIAELLPRAARRERIPFVPYAAI